jgi:large conductance mechanosensitive channel
MWTQFRAFLARGNVVDLAVGVVIGAAFGKIVTTFVEGVIMPPLGMVLGKVDFSNLMLVLDYSKGAPASLADAKTKGIPVIAYGQLFNDVVGFTIVAAAVFLLVKTAQRLREEPAPPAASQKECPSCAMSIPLKATRCPHCTSPIV